KEVGPVLLEMFNDKTRPALVRVEMLKALEALKDSRLPKAMEDALADADPHVRTQGRKLLSKLEPTKILAELNSALDKGTVVDRQGAFAILGELKQPDAEAVLERWLDKLLARQLPPEVQLDLLEAAAKNPGNGVQQKLKAYEAARDPKDHLARWRESLFG